MIISWPVMTSWPARKRSSPYGDDHVVEVNLEGDPPVLVREGLQVRQVLDIEVVAFAVVANQKRHFTTPLSHSHYSLFDATFFHHRGAGAYAPIRSRIFSLVSSAPSSLI